MIPKVGDIYKHFKGNLYKIIAIAKDSETLELMVVYQALYGNYEIYVRSLEMFMSKVDAKKYPEAAGKNRFEPVDAIVQTAPVEIMPEPQHTSEEVTTEEPQSNLNPLVEEFLDADTIDERKKLLVALQDSVTQDDITIMSTVMDIEIDQDLELSERYRQLMNCLDTKSRFETLRLR